MQVVDLKQIRQRYLIQKRGWINLAAALPYDLLPLILYYSLPKHGPDFAHPFGWWQVNPFLLAWAYLRVPRFIPIARMVYRWLFDTDTHNSNEGNKVGHAIQRLLYNLLTFILMGHLSTCIFW
jgi:hypothetical protein